MKTSSLYSRLTAHVGGTLKADGFDGSKGLYRLNMPDVVLVIEIQQSAKATHSKLAVTVNLGVAIKSVAEKLGEDWARARPLDCHWEQRIGMLMPEKKDVWWPLITEEDERCANEQILAGLHAWGLPAMMSVASKDRMRALWLSGTSPGRSDADREWYLKQIT